MRRKVIAASVAALGLLLTSCDFVGGGDTLPQTTSPASTTPTTREVTITPTTPVLSSTSGVNVPSAQSPAEVRRATCEELLGQFDQLRSDKGQAEVDKAAEDTIAKFPGLPRWSVFTEDQRQASIEGVRDAARGECV
ncbi:hypothetical protein [Nocardia sp. NPDC050406]|uniref:hypothetical protein n=1 Tax=Nocardia sp. NPDC050406 TaxID=3364318 RepID=UPI0037899CF0